MVLKVDIIVFNFQLLTLFATGNGINEGSEVNEVSSKEIANHADGNIYRHERSAKEKKKQRKKKNGKVKRKKDKRSKTRKGRTNELFKTYLGNFSA